MSSVSFHDRTGTIAQNYQRYFVPAVAAPVSEDLLRAADLGPGERVVDVACGTGWSPAWPPSGSAPAAR